jgi:hypothetical protein
MRIRNPAFYGEVVQCRGFFPLRGRGADLDDEFHEVASCFACQKKNVKI